MKATFLLLIPYILIRTIIGELIEIKTPNETRNPNVSETMDKAIIQNDIHRANYTPISMRDPSNMTIVPWPMSRILRNENLQLPNSEDSTSSPNLVSSPAPRMPKGMKISTNHSSGVTTGGQMIPVGQTGYLSWNEMSVKPNPTIGWGMKKSESGKVHDSGTNNDVGETYFRRRNERRKKDEIISQYDENNQYDDYTAPDKYSSASNYAAENINAYPASYGSSSGQYESGNYDSYSMKNLGGYRNEQSSADYSRSPNPWPSSHRPRPINSEGFSRFTVESSNDYRFHGEAPPSLISIFFAIGSNLLQLFKIGLGSGLSLAIPIIALKIFVIPLKILTFIKIVKIILKLVFIVPFFLRVFGPSISSAIGYHGTEFTNKMVGVSTQESREMIDQVGEKYTWLNNLTGVLPEALSPKHCPSRVACELGSFLASKSNIPKKMNNYLANNDLEGNEDFHEGRNENDREVTTVFVKALTQRWAYNQCDVRTAPILTKLGSNDLTSLRVNQGTTPVPQ